MKCAHCHMSLEDLRNQFPFSVKIVKENDYNLPVGRIFPFARFKDGNASPFPVIIRGNWPSYFHGREYQMKVDEVEILNDRNQGKSV